jgi:tRNA1(Val) A37 N6-methylase TrmN6
MQALPTKSAAMTAELVDASEDAILGGRLVLRQPLKGHRVGHDAVLLAAAVSARPGDHAVELGAGIGAAGLAIARRVDTLAVTLVEIDPALTTLARDNASGNRLAERVRAVCLDVTAPAEAFVAAGLAGAAADHVLMNPPFNPAQNPSPHRGRRLAHEKTHGSLARWLETAVWLLRPLGIVTLIWRADRLDELLAALAADFGALGILPVYPKAGVPAIRVLVRAVKASRAPLTLWPGLVLTDEAGKPTAPAEAVLREGALLRLAED